MTPCEDELFSYSDLPTVAPWLSKETCQLFREAGLFTPRMVQQETDPETPHMSLYDLIAVTALHQLLRCGVTVDQLRKALYAPSSFRCDEFSGEDLIFLSTGAIHGQELSRFLEVTNALVTILLRLPLDGAAEIEIIPNEHLGPKDFKGETLTGVECKAIRDLIRANIASSITRVPGQGDFRDHPRA